jgi:hypothetical protein
MFIAAAGPRPAAMGPRLALLSGTDLDSAVE